MKHKAIAVTDIGNYRKSNQDYLGYAKNKSGNFFAVVCDGMGGHAHGEIASKMAVTIFLKIFKKTNFSNLTDSEINRWLRDSIQQILTKMQEFGQTNYEALDMGTTLTSILFANDKVFVLNIGDSRTYKFSKGKLYQITKDQNLWNSTPSVERERIRKLGIYGGRLNELTYWKILTSGLGPKKTLKIDTFLIKNAEGTYFLSTDGVHDYFDEEGVIEILESKQNLKKKSKKIIELAKGNLSTDNLSILMIEVK